MDILPFFYSQSYPKLPQTSSLSSTSRIKTVKITNKRIEMGWLELFEENQQDIEIKQQISEKMSVLVVDDEEHITNTVDKYLSHEKYQVFVAGNGLEALEIYKSQSPRIIITDILMPGMDGLELLSTIRETDDETEVIVLTGHGDMSIAVKALKNKASEFLIKPVDLEVLLNSVQNAESRLVLKDEVKSYTAELEELFKEVHHSRDYLETVLQNSPNATITYNTTGIITSWNEAAEKVTGFTKTETVGKTVKDVFIFESHLIDTGNTNQKNDKQNIVGQILTKDQKMRFINRNANILYDSENKIIGGIESFYDTTEKTQSDQLLEKRYMQVQTINEIGKRVAASIEVGELIGFISKRLVTTFFESANIFFLLINDQKEKLVLRAASGIQINDVLEKLPINSEIEIEDLYGHVYKTGKSGLYSNANKSEYFSEGFSKEVASVFTFPIKSNDKKYGLLHIENAEKMSLDDGDIFMMETIAEYLAISLDKLELVEKITTQNHLIEQQNKTLLKDLKKAGDFQKSLLPEHLPVLEDYKFAVSFSPSNQLGGDYYDVFQISERFVGVLVSDASGHGVASAMLSAMFKMTLEKYSSLDIDPASVFKKINYDFCQVVQTGDFFTSFYGIVDLQTNKFIYSNAAHPLPLLYNYETREISELDSEGFLLGIMDDGITYESKELEFKGKSRLFIFTDGLHEEVNKKNEQYGEERVKENLIKYSDLDKQEFLDNIVTDLKQFTGRDTFEDDLTLLVMDISV
ncbi:MAG: response regulator [Calditrichaeota bacterium]|nr:MAG: response regulator [Calditrichota bacterium]MBL1204478.1 response regulator [Calditrichota bacterium]NOG44307.1 SpoIIE family protein phosphatase [Calditrichota bacterium]